MMIFSFAAGGILQVAMWSNATSYGAIIAFSALVYALGGWFFMLMPAVAAQVRSLSLRRLLRSTDSFTPRQLFGLRGLATITGYVVTGTLRSQLRLEAFADSSFPLRAGQSPGQLAGASISGAVYAATGDYKYVAYYAGSMMIAGAAFMVPGASYLSFLLPSSKLTLLHPRSARLIRAPFFARY